MSNTAASLFDSNGDDTLLDDFDNEDDDEEEDGVAMLVERAVRFVDDLLSAVELEFLNVTEVDEFVNALLLEVNDDVEVVINAVVVVVVGAI